MSRDPHQTPDTEVTASDPNADSAAGLGGDMGISSERTGSVRGVTGEVTHGAEPGLLDLPEPVDPVPEQNPDPARGPEPHPDTDETAETP